MERREQAITLLKRFQQIKQPNVLKKISELDAGMLFILSYLSENKTDIYASEISGKMQVSRARVGALLKKMENKGLITKSKSTTDSRIEIISITSEGEKIISSTYDMIINDTIRLIELVGYEELDAYLNTTEKIQHFIDE